jgi:plasmid maintenance system antidote protein VapI
MKCLDAQKAGKIRFIGFTGHRSPVHSELVNGKRGISPETVVRISKVFGGSPESWLTQLI